MIEIVCLWSVTLIAIYAILHMHDIIYSVYVIIILSLLATGLILL